MKLGEVAAPRHRVKAPQHAAASGLGVLAIMIAIRRGLIGRLPFLGPQVRAFRRASLRRAIETAQGQLARLEARDNRPKSLTGGRE